MTIIGVELEEWHSSPVIREYGDRKAERWPANRYRDEPAGPTERQAVFERNLLRLSRAIGSRCIPVDFFLKDRGHVFLDRGCTKIAEHAGFIKPLKNGPSGVVEYVELSDETVL